MKRLNRFNWHRNPKNEVYYRVPLPKMDGKQLSLWTFVGCSLDFCPKKEAPRLAACIRELVTDPVVLKAVDHYVVIWRD